jgi:hypothetical protein
MGDRRKRSKRRPDNHPYVPPTPRQPPSHVGLWGRGAAERRLPPQPATSSDMPARPEPADDASGPWRWSGTAIDRPEPNLYTIVQMDVANSARWYGRSLERMRNDLFDLIGDVASGCDIDLESLPCDDNGDGLRLLLPIEVVGPTTAIDTFTSGLAAGLREHRKRVRSEARIRLRMAFHVGLVTRHRGSWTGSSLVVPARLVNSKPLRQALKAGADVDLAVAVSDGMYQVVVRDHYGHIPLTCYREIRVRVKEYRNRAWLLVPRSACICGLPITETPHSRRVRVQSGNTKEQT